MKSNANQEENIERGLTVAIEFKCNCDCFSCMIKDTMKGMAPISFSEFKKIIKENLKTRKFSRLILSGAEVTMNDDLLKFVDYAKKKWGFQAYSDSN